MNVYLTGAENNGWALDTDLRFAKQAVTQFAKIVDKPWKANVIHSVSPLMSYKKIYGKEVVAVFPGNPNRLFEADAEFLDFAHKSVCVAQTNEGYMMLKKAKIEKAYCVPYIADLKNFFIIEDKAKLRAQFNIPSDKMVIGNFMRDSLGANLQVPKQEKGADIFCEIVKGTVKRIGNQNVCVLLAGPRRHWIRGRLEELGIQYIYIGKITREDDFKANILNSQSMNKLINACDVLVVSSRSEGGPRTILEAAQAQIPIISSDVGIASDVLNSDVIYHSILQAQEMLVKHYKTNFLQKYCEEQYRMVNKMCSVESVASKYKEIYSEIGTVKGRKTKFVLPKKYIRNKIKSIGILGYKETDFFCKALYNIIEEMGIRVYMDKDIKNVDVLVSMPWIGNSELKGIHYKKNYVYCIPNVLNKVSYTKNMMAYDGIIFFDRETWHKYLEEEKPVGKEIVLSNYIVPKSRRTEKINILLAKEDGELQKKLEENFDDAKIIILPKEMGIVDEIENADIYVSNCNAGENVFGTSVVLHYGIITVYADIGDNRKTFGVQAFGYDTLSECVENIKYISSNINSIQGLIVSKGKKEIADGLLKVL